MAEIYAYPPGMSPQEMGGDPTMQGMDPTAPGMGHYAMGSMMGDPMAGQQMSMMGGEYTASMAGGVVAAAAMTPTVFAWTGAPIMEHVGTSRMARAMSGGATGSLRGATTNLHGFGAQGFQPGRWNAAGFSGQRMTGSGAYQGLNSGMAAAGRQGAFQGGHALARWGRTMQMMDPFTGAFNMGGAGMRRGWGMGKGLQAGMKAAQAGSKAPWLLRGARAALFAARGGAAAAGATGGAAPLAAVGLAATEATIGLGTQMYEGAHAANVGTQTMQNMGMDYSTADSQTFGVNMRQMGSQYGMTSDQVGGFAEQMGAMGEFDKTKSARDVKQQLSKKLDQLQQIVQATDSTIEEVTQKYQMMKSMGMKGDTAVGETLAFSAKMKASGLTDTQMMGAGIRGQQHGTIQGLGQPQGYQQGQAAYGAASLMTQQGKLGPGQVGSFAENHLQMQADFMSGAGGAMAGLAYDSSTGKIDQDVLARVKRGDVSTKELKKSISTHGGRMNMQHAMGNRKLMADLAPDAVQMMLGFSGQGQDAAEMMGWKDKGSTYVNRLDLGRMQEGMSQFNARTGMATDAMNTEGAQREAVRKDSFSHKAGRYLDTSRGYKGAASFAAGVQAWASRDDMGPWSKGGTFGSGVDSADIRQDDIDRYKKGGIRGGGDPTGGTGASGDMGWRTGVGNAGSMREMIDMNYLQFKDVSAQQGDKQRRAAYGLTWGSKKDRNRGDQWLGMGEDQFASDLDMSALMRGRDQGRKLFKAENMGNLSESQKDKIFQMSKDPDSVLGSGGVRFGSGNKNYSAEDRRLYAAAKKVGHPMISGAGQSMEDIFSAPESAETFRTSAKAMLLSSGQWQGRIDDFEDAFGTKGSDLNARNVGTHKAIYNNTVAAKEGASNAIAALTDDWLFHNVETRMLTDKIVDDQGTLDLFDKFVQAGMSREADRSTKLDRAERLLVGQLGGADSLLGKTVVEMASKSRGEFQEAFGDTWKNTALSARYAKDLGASEQVLATYKSSVSRAPRYAGKNAQFKDAASTWREEIQGATGKEDSVNARAEATRDLITATVSGGAAEREHLAKLDPQGGLAAMAESVELLMGGEGLGESGQAARGTLLKTLAPRRRGGVDAASSMTPSGALDYLAGAGVTTAGQLSKSTGTTGVAGTGGALGPGATVSQTFWNTVAGSLQSTQRILSSLAGSPNEEGK